MGPLFLIAAAFFSSTLTAVLGLGGGVLLISLMPGVLPAAAVVPVHGVVQLAANVTRALFGARHILWRLVAAFAGGAAVGAAAGSQIVVTVPSGALPVLLGVFVLVVTWLPKRWLALDLPGRYVSVGAVQTFLSLFVGAAGPLLTPVLLRDELSRDRIVVNHGAMMSVLHSAKLLAFALLGFSLRPYLPLIAGMIASVSLGSYVGTRLRTRVPEDLFRSVLKVVLTLLALRLILKIAV